MENKILLEEELPEELEQMLNAKQEKRVYAGNRVWKKLHKVVTSIQMKFTAAQIEAFKGLFSNFYLKAGNLHDFALMNYLKRLELNVGRMLCVVFLMRLLGKLKDSLTGYPISI